MLLRSSGFARVHSGGPSCCCVPSGSLGFTRAQLEVVGFIGVRIASRLAVVGFARVHSGASCGLVHSCSRGLTWARLVVVGLIRVRVGSLGRA